MSVTAHIQPRLRVLTPEQAEEIHRRALHLLATVGLRVDSDRARTLFAAAHDIVLDGDRVRIRPDAVARALASAPRHINVYDRGGRHAFQLGDMPARFGTGVTNLYYEEPATGSLTPFGRQHMALGARLTEVLPGYDCVSTLGILHDVPVGTEDLYGVLEMAANTAKPLIILVSDERQFVPALDLLEHVCGDLGDRPYVIPYLNPVTPLILNRETADKMIATVERGLPLIYSNYSMAGATAPITPAGMLALLTAELLAGLVLSQLVRRGAPIILGSLPAYFDMQSMLDFYDPLSVLLNAACAEMMAHYGVPHAGTSGCGLGAGADLPAAGMLWLNHLAACTGQTGLVPFVGGSLGSKVFSPAVAVYAHDIIQQARRFAAGFEFDEGAAVLDEVTALGPGGNYLKARSTRLRYRSAYYTSPVFPRMSLERWEELGQPRSDEALTAYTLDLMARAQPPADHDEVVDKGERYLRH